MNIPKNNETPVFTKLFDFIETSTEFDMTWKSDSGYFDNLITWNLQHFVDKNTPIVVVKTVDDVGRRMVVIVSIGKMNVVLFELFNSSSNLIASSMEPRFKSILGGDIWNDSDIYNIHIAIIEMKLKKDYPASDD